MYVLFKSYPMEIISSVFNKCKQELHYNMNIMTGKYKQT